MKTKHISHAFVILGLTAINSFAAQAEGDLVKGSTDSVYVIQAGKRCPIPNPAVFDAKGFKAENIIVISDADLKAIPEGPVVEAPVKPYKAKDGDLVKGSGNAVYVVQSGKRCGIPDPATFEAKGFKGENIIVISDAELNTIPEGPAVEAPIKPYKVTEGDLVKASGDGIFVIKGGKRCGINSPEIFNTKGYKWDKVIKISDADFDAIPEGDPVE